MSVDSEAEETKRQALVQAKKLVATLSEHSTKQVILSAEWLIAYRAVRDRMPLQELMDNLLRNMPAMYAIVLEAEVPQDLVTLEEKDG